MTDMATPTKVNGSTLPATANGATIPQSRPAGPALQVTPPAANTRRTKAPTAPAGWYPSQDSPTGKRYWDGTDWTGKTNPPRRLNLHGTTLLLPVLYAAAVVIASYGGIEAIGPLVPELPKFFVVLGWLFIEAFGVLMMAIAKTMLEKGRKSLALAAAIASVLVAAGVATMNFIGHRNNVITACLFAGSSVLAYFAFVLTTIDSALDAALLTGRREESRFRYPLAERLFHWQRTQLAEELMSRNPGLDPGEARWAAKDYPIVVAATRRHLATEVIGHDAQDRPVRRTSAEVDNMILQLHPHELVPMFEERMGPLRDQLVSAMVAGMSPSRPAGTRTTRPAGHTSARAPRPAAAGATKVATRRVVVEGGGNRSRRTPDEVRLAYDRLEAANPGQTKKWYAEQLGYTSERGLHKALSAADAAGSSTIPERTQSP